MVGNIEKKNLGRFWVTFESSFFMFSGSIFLFKFFKKYYSVQTKKLQTIFDLKIWKELGSKVPLCPSFVHCVLVCVGCENLLFSQAKCPPVEELPSPLIRAKGRYENVEGGTVCWNRVLRRHFLDVTVRLKYELTFIKF